VNRGFPRPSESRPEWAHEEQRGRSETAPLRLKLMFHFRSVKELCRQRFHPIDSKFHDEFGRKTACKAGTPS
jgi:hypothetical protein